MAMMTPMTMPISSAKNVIVSVFPRPFSKSCQRFSCMKFVSNSDLKLSIHACKANPPHTDLGLKRDKMKDGFFVPAKQSRNGEDAFRCRVAD